MYKSVIFNLLALFTEILKQMIVTLMEWKVRQCKAGKVWKQRCSL